MNIAAELAALQRLTVSALRSRYAELFGEATSSNHKTWLIKRIVWRLQARMASPLSERARQYASELARDAEVRLSAPKLATAHKGVEGTTPPYTANQDERLPGPGTILIRRYKGQLLHVKVLADGFEWQGAVYRSLTAVAKAITGGHCNGYLFFRLGKYGEAR